MSHDPTIMATLELLAARWPAAFAVHQARRRPLAIGIHRDILAALDGAVTPDELSRALRFYTGNRVYLRRIAAGVTRVDLNGAPAGVITEKEAAYARAIERRRLNRLAAKQIAAKQIASAPLPKPAPPQRLSLADLREAAQRRKAAVS